MSHGYSLRDSFGCVCGREYPTAIQLVKHLANPKASDEQVNLDSLAALVAYEGALS